MKAVDQSQQMGHRTNQSRAGSQNGGV